MAASTSRQEDEAAMLQTVREFLSCIKSRDEARMRSLGLLHGTACLHRPHRSAEAEQPMVMTIERSIARVFELTAAEDEADEQGHDETVHLDDGAVFGCVWSPYKFLMRAKLQHTGSSVYSMVKIDGKWIISGFADVARMLQT